jgi:hypothetical protein
MLENLVFEKPIESFLELLNFIKFFVILFTYCFFGFEFLYYGEFVHRLRSEIIFQEFNVAVSEVDKEVSIERGILFLFPPNWLTTIIYGL